jgi:hypothetical protein
MEEAAVVRAGARELLANVEPEGLRERADEVLDDAWAAPGVVTLVAARKVGIEDGGADLRRRAVGTQLIYAGLSLTRDLVEAEPWTDGADAAGNLNVLVADVLVARGAGLLAYTEAADNCVEVIRSFGAVQTEGDAPPDADRTLEADALNLAAVAGSTAVGGDPAPAVVEWAEGLGASLGPGDRPTPSALVAGEPAAGVQAVPANERPSGDP